MIMGSAAQAREVISFGPFRLVIGARLLMKDGVPLELGARTLDILIALVSRPNEIVSKADLMAQVWPDVTVEEGSLRFHVNGLRKMLGDGKDGARYITTMTGRGYCFVASISYSTDKIIGEATATHYRVANFLPTRLARMVGRADGVQALSTLLTTARFVTIVGPGGVGKTTLAVAVAHDLLENFAGETLFVDLGMLSDPNMVAASLASMLGISVRSADPTPDVIAHLCDKRILVILDNCEHVVAAAAALAARLFLAAPQVHILATSREALRVEGEHVYRLEPLAVPPEGGLLTAAAALKFPATQLFAERANASGARLAFGDSDVTIVASICRKLDGVALAIELAAGRVQTYGLEQTAALLDERLSLLWVGQRSAPPRQQTLKATLDWSYELLSELERMVLRGLAVFVGDFTLDAARAVLTSATIDQYSIFEAIDSLVAKSMVATRPDGATVRYRLLDTTRAYVLEADVGSAALADLGSRHAVYHKQWLERSTTEGPVLSNSAEREPYLAGLANVRAALEWCFGDSGNTRIGIELVAAAAPLLLKMSLLTECCRWSERAILALDDATRSGLEEMHLQEALGMSLMFTRGMSDAAYAAFERSFAIAETRGDALNQLQLLGPLHMFHHRIGDFKGALQIAKRSRNISTSVTDPAAIALAHALLGMSFSYLGDLGGARVELEAALQHRQGSWHSSTIYLGFDHYTLASAALGRTLWLQGHPAQAVERAHQTVREAESMGHPVSLSIGLIWAISVFLWAGDLVSAEEYIDWFVSHAKSQSLGPYFAVGRGFKGQYDICRGDARSGVASLQLCLEELHASRYELLSTQFTLSLVQGLAAMGRRTEGVARIDDAIRLVEEKGDLSFMPELLRMKGNLLLTMQVPAVDKAEMLLLRSGELSRSQGALAWQLRSAVDLAGLWAARGDVERAHDFLRPVYAQFNEGLDTTDLRTANQLLATLV
jgi:predicted ATPase/DNA-binding winged helix-turn-helix (wHTH) protein